MRVGESLMCPLCGEKTVVKSKTVMDGWNAAGTKLVCALCGGILSDPEPETGNRAASRAAADRFASLLGDGAVTVPGADLTPDGDYGRFCRNCTHFVAHPFKTLCSYHNRPADPMGDCPDFEKKKDH